MSDIHRSTNTLYFAVVMMWLWCVCDGRS